MKFNILARSRKFEKLQTIRYATIRQVEVTFIPHFYPFVIKTSTYVQANHSEAF